MKGWVHQVNVKPKTPGERGLPKKPVSSCQVARSGLLGDFNIYRHEQLQDDPDSAVLLMPLEALKELNSEGWPIEPGDIGENITTTGIPYDHFAPGKVFRVGGVRLQVTRACVPCDNLYQLPFVGKTKGPAFLKTMLGRRGWYARVLTEGVVAKGDLIYREE
jgi:MOSC domain-containing protein YiiM